MNAVVAFPSPMANGRTPPAVEVIVAPAADVWVAWLRLPCGRYTALERTPCQGHALADARAYAGRHRIPVSALDRPLALVLDRSVPSQRRRGEIGIWPDPAGSGWQVERAGERGGCIAVVGRAASLDEALTIARDAARQLGATFDDPFPNFGGAA